MTGGSGARTDPTALLDLSAKEVPLALADLHRDLEVGVTTTVSISSGWPEQRLRDVVIGAGFVIDDLTAAVAVLRRERTLPDTVGPDMRLLVCGLNPSVLSADVGIGFARPGNRYWPAALAAGLVSRDRDTRHALAHHGVGMTDLVKRATPRADALTTDEYRDGVGRVGRLVEWLRPGAVVMVGLAGWRAAVDRKAVAGVQAEPFGGRPVYVMPSTSGLNASSRLEDLTAHLASAAALADRA